MSDVIGRFLSFDEQLGRGLVKFAYFLSLFYLVVIHVVELFRHLIHLEIGPFLLVPFKFLLFVLALRIAAEFLIAVLSINDRLQEEAMVAEAGSSSGLTPEPGTPVSPSSGGESMESPAPDMSGDDRPAEV